jgi:hypothetical protein
VLLPADGNSLQTKLGAALDLLSGGNTRGAIGKLKDFVRQVTAFIRTGTLTPAEGQPLIDGAEALMAELEGSGTLSTKSAALDASARDMDAAISGAVAQSFRLYPAMLDAASGAFTLRFDLPRTSVVTLEFYDIAGRRIDEVNVGSMGPGQHEWNWASQNSASGLLFYRLRAGDLVATGKVVSVR